MDLNNLPEREAEILAHAMNQAYDLGRTTYLREHVRPPLTNDELVAFVEGLDAPTFAALYYVATRDLGYSRNPRSMEAVQQEFCAHLRIEEGDGPLQRIADTMRASAAG